MKRLTGPRNAHLFASDDDDLLSGQKLLGNDAGKAAQEMVAAVDDLDFRAHHGEGLVC